MMQKNKKEINNLEDKKRNEILYCIFIVIVIVFIAMGDQIALHFFKSNPNPNNKVFGGAEKENYTISFLQELSLDEVLEKVNQKENFLLLSSKSDCVVCEKMLPVLEEDYDKRKVDIYYFNKDLYDNSMESLKKFQEVDEKINVKIIYTPYLMYFENGLLKDDMVGETNKDKIEDFLIFNGIIES